MPDVDYPVNRSDANDPEPDHSEATQDRRATTSIFDDRLEVKEKRRRGNTHVPDTSRSENRADGGRFDESGHDDRSVDRRSVNNRTVDNHSGDHRSVDNRSGDRRSVDNRTVDNRSGNQRDMDRRDGTYESRSDDGHRSQNRRFDSIAAAPSEEAVKVTMEARRKMTQAAKRSIDQTRTQSPDIRNSINSSFPSEDM